MEEKRKSPLGWVTPVLIGFVLGTIFGLIIGWGVWPVTWKDATPAILDANSRQLYLRAAIDSYMVNQDANLAKERYDSLGEYSASTLSAINSNPLNQTPQAVQAFANAVGASAVLQSPPGVPPNTAQPVSQASPQPAASEPAATAPAAAGQATPTASGGGGLGGLISGLLAPGLLACLALLLGLALILFLFNRARRRTRARTAEASTSPAAIEETLPAGHAPLSLDEASRPAPTNEPATPAEIPDWLQEAAPSQPTPPAETAYDLPPAEPLSNELPDWLQETAAVRGVAEPSASAASAPAPAEELPDWLNETAATPTSTHQPASSTPAEELPDWLNEAAAAPALAWEPQETAEQTHAKFSQDLAGLPAMEPEFARRLRAAGVSMPMMLLKKGATPESRLKLAEKAGIDAAELATWVNVVDLFRVRGLNTEHALLLDGVGVHGVNDLAAANPANLTEELNKINQEAGLLAEAPSLAEVSHWIGQAQQLPQAVQPG